MKKSNIFYILTALTFVLVLGSCDDKMYKPGAPVPVENIELDPELAEGYSILVGETLDVSWKVTVIPTDATNKTEHFSSSDPSVATVDELGQVTALTTGTTTITITVDGKSVGFALTVIPRPVVEVTQIVADQDEFELVLETETLDLLSHLRLTPREATYSDVNFTSGNESVLLVDEKGVVTTVGIGTTTVTVASNVNPDVNVSVRIEVVAERVHPDYQIDENYVVTAYTGAGGEIEIPWWATSIAEGVFKNNTTITKVDLNNVTTIGNEVFSGCSNLTHFTAPRLAAIPNANVFSGTNELVYVNLGAVTKIDGKLFNGLSKLEELILPKVTYIDHDNLQNLTALKSVELPSVLEIGRDVFRSAVSLTSIDLPASLTTIHGGLCSGSTSMTEINIDPANTSFKSVDGVVYTKDGTSLVAHPSGITSSYRVADRATRVGRGAFALNTLTSLDLNETTDIVDYGLYRLLNLTTLLAPNVRTIAGAGLREVTALHFLALPSIVTLNGNAFQNNTNITLDLSEATGLVNVAGNAVPDVAGITIYVATEEIKAKFTGNSYTVIVGFPD